MKVFVSAMGQVDNIGDTALRRAYLAALRGVGPLNVFVGSRDESYVSGLGLSEADTLFRETSAWRRAISLNARQAPLMFAFNAGEIELQRSFAMRYARLMPVLALSRLRGGSAVHAGFGVREGNKWRFPISVVLRLCNLVSWRDELSRDAMGLGTVAPDWAFALGAPDSALLASSALPDRDTLAVAVRYNGPRHSSNWARSIRALADAQGLRIVTVAQITRDGPLAEELALELGGEALAWDGSSHAAYEERVRLVYRSSRFILTDRLHGAIMALTEGAIALALSESPRSKVTRTLAAIGVDEVSIDHALPSGAELISLAASAEGRRPEIMGHVVDARRRLADLTVRIRNLAT